MFKILIPAVAALGLVSHAAQSYSAEDSVDVAPVMLASKASVGMSPAAPVMDWHFHTEGDTAKLAYGVANSDQLVLMLTCKAGDATVSALGTVRAVADTATARTTMEDPMSGGILHEARIDRHDAALVELATTGTIQTISEQGKAALGTDSVDQEAVKAFFASCGSAPA